MTEKRMPRKKGTKKVVKKEKAVVEIKEEVTIVDSDGTHLINPDDYIVNDAIVELIRVYEDIVAPTPVESYIPFLISGSYTGCLAISEERARKVPDSLEAKIMELRKNLPSENNDFEHALVVLGFRQVFP